MIKEKMGSYINGTYHCSGEKETRTCVITHKTITTLYHATKSDIASGLLPSFALSTLSSYERSHLLMEVASQLLNRKEELSQLIVQEMGKPIREARGEIDYAAAYFTWFAEEAKRIYGQTIPSSHKGKRIELRYYPIGACGIITPWNFPIAMGARKIAPALAAGCPLVVKPAPETPLSMLLLAEIITEAGFPKGTCNVLVGDEKEIGKALTHAPNIKKLSFTGSTSIGSLLYQLSATTLKKVTMELGGNAPFIVTEDANIPAAVEGAIQAKFRNSGQTCICANRFLVHTSKEKQFTKALLERIETLNVGNPFEESTDISTYLHPQSATRIEELKEDTTSHGGLFLTLETKKNIPLVATNVTKKMRVFKEEIFGPLVSLSSFSSDEEALMLANDTEYGLASYVFTTSMKRAELYTNELQFGMIGMNDGAFSAAEFPFGGIKMSGFGREGGPTGMYEYLAQKSLSIRTV